MAEVKTGAKTTEFWVTLAPVFLALIEGKQGQEDPEMLKTLVICGSVLGGLYIISRTLVKYKVASKTQE